MKDEDPYLQQVHSVLPRLLALYDQDTISPTYGLGDRFHWAWKIIDFGNGTFQGAAHGLALLSSKGFLPDHITVDSVDRRIDAMFRGAEYLRRPNGSMEEAFPYESSFCVTALVAFDLISAIDLISNRLPADELSKYQDIVRPMIGYVCGEDETHGFISNHLATAAAALYRWHALTGEKTESRAKGILDRILGEQSEEGWFREYEGADPGYQSFCTYYLADIHSIRPDLGLLEPLRRSLRFLWTFAHPDGSFGGCYGSRNTRFYCPAGIEILSREIPEAAALAARMRNSIRRHQTVTLDVLDTPNLVPMFNAYCRAASAAEDTPLDETSPVPCEDEAPWRKHFAKAGIFVENSSRHFTVISTHKGGVCYHWKKDPGDECLSSIDLGVVAKSRDGRHFSTQAYNPENEVLLENDELHVVSQMTAMRHQVITPFKLVILRILGMTLMRNGHILRWIKQLLVSHLITKRTVSVCKNHRTVTLAPKLGVKDSFESNESELRRIDGADRFSAIHMASQGYWQIQDDAP